MTDGAPRILYLNRRDIAAVGGDHSELYVAALADGLVEHADGRTVQPLKPYLRASGSHIADRIIAMPAHVGDPGMSGLKWIGSKHDNPQRLGLERASAIIVLNDPATNYPVAFLEGSLISAWRTAAVSALAARHLARAGFTDVALIGCGVIGSTQVTALLQQFGQIETVHLFDIRPEAIDVLAARIKDEHDEHDVNVVVADSAEAAVRAGDVVVPCTVTDTPYIHSGWLKRGSLLCNVSIMDVHKDVFLHADKVIVDDWEQSNREKKIINQLVLEGVFSREQLHAELGEVVAGRKPGRESDDEVIVLNPMGMAVEDIACAAEIYRRAVERQVGTWLDLY